MRQLPDHRPKRTAGHDGFALPITLLALVVMSVVAVALLYTSVDEQRASRAVRLSVEAFYAAETGANAVQAAWNDTTQSLDSLAGALAPGDSLQIGGGAWQSLGNGARYRATLTRVDSGGASQRLYMLSVDGRNGSGRAPLRVMYTPAPGGPLTLGECCDAAVIMRGEARIRQGTGVSGIDTDPTVWDANGDCPDPLENKPGLLMQDTSLLDLDSPGWLNGNPPLDEDPAMSDATFDQFGDLDWAGVKTLAGHTIGEPGENESYSWGGDPADEDDEYGPRYNMDGSCDTSHPLNFGSDDPNSSCYNYFPVILVQGDVDMEDFGGYAQGVFILDLVGGIGSELDLEGVLFHGLIIGLGCVEVQYGSQFMGAIFVDGNYYNQDLCGSDEPLHTNHYDTPSAPATVTWSSCVVQRVLRETGLAQASGGGTSGAMKLSRHLERLLQ